MTKKAAKALLESDLVLGGNAVLTQPDIDGLGGAWEVIEPHTCPAVCPDPGDEPPVAVIDDEVVDAYERLLAGIQSKF